MECAPLVLQGEIKNNPETNQMPSTLQLFHSGLFKGKTQEEVNTDARKWLALRFLFHH